MNMFFYFRRLLLGFTIIYTEQFFLQLYSMSLQFIVMIHINQKRKSRFETNYEIFNEIAVLLVIYYVMCLLSAHGDAVFFHSVSWACILTVSIHTVICLTLISRDSCTKLKHRIRQRKSKKNLDQKVKNLAKDKDILHQ